MSNIVVEPELTTTVTTDVECSNTFQKMGSGMLEDMTEVATETDVKVLLDDNPGDGLKQHRYVPILHDLDTDNDLPIGTKNWGDKLALDTLQRADSQFDGDNLDVASGGSQHLETEIRKITQSPPMRNELSKSAKRRARRK